MEQVSVEPEALTEVDIYLEGKGEKKNISEQETDKHFICHSE